jgi:hypothetical protein
MDLIKFTSQLGGKDTTASPYRIPARDLDSNFSKLRPLPTDGNARQYAIEETPEGWFLRLFPDGLTPGQVPISEAPLDGNVYGRRNADWEPINQTPAIPQPPSSGTFVLGSVNGAIQWLQTEAC